MAESQGKGLKTPVNGLFHKNFEFEPLFGYDNFQNKIDTWETTVRRAAYATNAVSRIEEPLALLSSRFFLSLVNCHTFD